MLTTAIGSGAKKPAHSLRRDPKENLPIQNLVPLSWRHPLEALTQCPVAHGLLVADDSRPVYFMLDHDRFPAAATFDCPPLFSFQAIQVEKCRRTQEPML